MIRPWRPQDGDRPEHRTAGQTSFRSLLQRQHAGRAWFSTAALGDVAPQCHERPQGPWLDVTRPSSSCTAWPCERGGARGSYTAARVLHSACSLPLAILTSSSLLTLFLFVLASSLNDPHSFRYYIDSLLIMYRNLAMLALAGAASAVVTGEAPPTTTAVATTSSPAASMPVSRHPIYRTDHG